MLKTAPGIIFVFLLICQHKEHRIALGLVGLGVNRIKVKEVICYENDR